MDDKIYSADEFYEKYHQIKEATWNIFDDHEGDGDNSGVKRKSSKTNISIDQAIKEPPLTHEELTKFLQEHLRITNQKFFSKEDQQEIADTLTRAIVSIWPDNRKQSTDPFLSSAGNKELLRRIAVYIVQTAEELFYEYISKAQELNEKAVFSAEANLVRLKTQILHEANTCLNALKARRKLASYMRHFDDKHWLKKDYEKENVVQYSSDNNFKSRMEKDHLKFLKKQIDDINSHINVFDFSALTLSYKQEIPQENLITPADGEDDIYHSEDPKMLKLNSADDEKCPSPEEQKICRSSSMPDLQPDPESVEEFRELDVVLLERTKSIDQVLTDSLKENNDMCGQFPAKKAFDNDAEELDDEFSSLLQAQETRVKRKRKPHKSVPVLVDDEKDLFDDMLADEIDDGEKITSFKSLIQPSFVNAKIPGKGIVRITDSSITKRIDESKLTLQKYPTMYNEFLDEIDDETVKSLDEHLFAGKQAQEVYDEITKTMNKDFLCFDADEFVENCAPINLKTKPLFMSSLLREKKKKHLVNEELRSAGNPPWNESSSYVDWMNQPRFGEIGREEILHLMEKNKGKNKTANANFSPTAFSNTNVAINSDPHFLSNSASVANVASATTTHDFSVGSSVAKIHKSYSSWLTWYKNHLDMEDYKKFVFKEANDHLCQIHHLYDSEDSDLEEENLHNKLLEMQMLEEEERRKKEIREQKMHYEDGFWNAQCVVLGGLGKYPDLNLQPEQKDLDQRELNNIKDDDSLTLTLQERLERLWKLLKVPESHRIDMAMKYSDLDSGILLPEIIEYWEEVTDLIVQREHFIGILEDFERSASDPNRFFQKGQGGSSIARINEGKTREKLIRNIKTLEVEIKPKLGNILRCYGDEVTFQGRNYGQKMQTDRVEMLYWLQQERRQQALICTPHETIRSGQFSQTIR